MSEKRKRVSYSTRARSIALKYPYFTAVSTQINFWILAYLLMVSILYLGFKAILRTVSEAPNLHFGPPLILAVFIGASYGFIIGSINYFLDKKVFSNLPLWRVIVYQSLISIIVLLSLVFFSRTILFVKLVELFAIKGMLGQSTGGLNLTWAIIIYTFVMSFLINFINQMNKKFGPGVLIPMLMGRFRNPKEEERVFMFLDLKNSTSLAENLGHLKYSAFVRDCFQDINSVVKSHLAEIYQYVGDEIVLSWEIPLAFENQRVFSFYFSCQGRFRERQAYYLKEYDAIPEFKAGVHMGIVTMVEVGDVKRDIAYHGETLNVASRIEYLCKKLDEDILISEEVVKNLRTEIDYFFESLGKHDIRGKSNQLEVYRVIQNN